MEELIRQNYKFARSLDNQEALESPLFTTTPTANATPVADASGVIDAGWLPPTTVYGTGAANQIAYWSAPQTLTSDDSFYVSAANKILNIDNNGSGTAALTLGDVANSNYLRIQHTSSGQSRISRFVVSGQALIDIDPEPADGVSAANFRFFRSTNTAGSSSFDIFIGDGTATFNHRIFGSGGNTQFCLNNGLFAIGTSSPTTQLHVIYTDAVTNAVTNVATIAHYSSGTPAAGFGAGLSFQLESSTTNARDSGRITSSWATATDASRAARMTFSCYYITTERECFRIEANSSSALIGFLGATAVARQTVSGNNGGLPGLTSLLTGIANLGLITNSTSNTDSVATEGATNVFTALNTFDAHINASRVGIGVTGTPSRLLEIISTATSMFLGRTDSDAVNPVFEVQDNSPGQARTMAFNFLNSASVSRGQIAYFTATDAMRFNTAGSERVRIDSSGQFGIATSSPAALFHVALNNATTSAYNDIAIFDHNSSGTPAAGFGSSILFRLESSTTADQSAARIIVHWTTATHASRAVKGALTAYYTSTERECIAWGSDATNALIGFLGATPVARQTITGSRGGNAALASLLTGLSNEGLITDSTTA